MKLTTHRNAGDKSGIALVIVLSFLGILVLLAVTFSVSMRTERLAAEFGQQGVEVKHFLHGALAAAMEDVNFILDEQEYIRTPKSYAIMTSESGQPIGDNLYPPLLQGEAELWLPKNRLFNSDIDFNGYLAASNATWVLVNDGSGGASAPLVGRYAYIAVDCSGLFDANMIVEDPVRANGTSVMHEISFERLPEVNTVTKHQNFFRNRTNYNRFASLPEVLFLNDGLQDSTRPLPFTELTAVTSNRFAHLMPYSLFRPATAVYDFASGNWTAVRSITNIGSADFGRGSWDQGTAWRSYQDYIDDDYLPGATAPGVPDVNVPSCENIPMINEIVVTNQVDRSGGDATLSTKVDVELWYPFPNSTNEMAYTLRWGALGEFRSRAIFPPAAGGGFVDDVLLPNILPLIPIDINVPAPGAANDISVYSFGPYTRTQAWPFGTNSGVRFLFLMKDLEFELVEQPSGDVVDRVTLSDSITLDINPNDVVLPVGRRDGRSVNDPRLNHLSSQWDQPNPTLGHLNTNVTRFNISDENDGYEGTNLYVANGALRNVGELGFIKVDSRPWVTVDLFSESGRQMLDEFVIDAVIHTNYLQGFVNPNTLSTSVLDSVFYDCPLDLSLGGNRQWNDISSVGLLVRAMVLKNEDADVSGNDQFTSPAAWANLGVMSNASPGDIDAPLAAQNIRDTLNNTEREEIIRNSYRLFNPGQNLFTFVVVAQTINDQDPRGTYDPNEDTITGERRCVALVWRDPFPNEDGRHNMFVRLFKYLDE